MAAFWLACVAKHLAIPAIPAIPAISLSRLLDYSVDYGVGYLTSSGCVGAAFNDGSGLLASPDLRRCEYRQKSARGRGDTGAAAAPVVVLHGGRGAGCTQSAALEKKLRLLECFARCAG